MAGFRSTQLSHRYDELREPSAGLAIEALIEDQGLQEQITMTGSYTVSSETEYLEGIKYTDNRPSTTDAEKSDYQGRCKKCESGKTSTAAEFIKTWSPS